MNFSFLYQFNIKKLLFVILFLALCVGLGFGIYWLFFKGETSGPGEPGYVAPGGSLPSVSEGPSGEVVGPSGSLPSAGDVGAGEGTGIDIIAQGGDTLVLPLYDNKVTDAVLSADGNGISFYSRDDNKFYAISNDGRYKIPLSDKEFYGVQKVYWSDNRSQAIISYPDESKILYDFTQNKQITLNKEIQEPDFSNADKIAYKFISEDRENNWLAVADAKGSQVTLIEPLGENADSVQVSWSPTNQVAALYAKPTGVNESEVYFIGLGGENFKSLTVAGSNFKGLWSPNGAKLLYQVVSSANNFNPSLWITDAEGDNIGRYKFNLGLSTWVDKCVFADSLTVYCAVPRELPQGMGLYPEYVDVTKDLIYKINLTTGIKELIANPILDDQNNFSISSLYISNDGKYLFFWDSLTEKIYRIQLK